MTAKEYLRQYEEACRKARRLENEYNAELDLVDNVRSTLGGDGMPHGNGISRKVEDQAIRLADKALAWKQAQLEAIRIRQEIFDLVNSIEGIEGEILTERYVNLHKWEEVCVLVHLSWMQTHRRHAKALEKIEAVLRKDGIE